jgi:hypothetical protein
MARGEHTEHHPNRKVSRHLFSGGGDDAHETTHGEEDMTRTQSHPLQGRGGADTVGTYLGFTGNPTGPRSHFFSAESTEGGETDSHIINDAPGFNTPAMNVGARYAFDRKTGSPGNITPYNPKTHYGIAGAPMSDTPAKYHDRNYR